MAGIDTSKDLARSGSIPEYFNVLKQGVTSAGNLRALYKMLENARTPDEVATINNAIKEERQKQNAAHVFGYGDVKPFVEPVANVLGKGVSALSHFSDPLAMMQDLAAGAPSAQQAASPQALAAARNVPGFMGEQIASMAQHPMQTIGGIGGGIGGGALAALSGSPAAAPMGAGVGAGGGAGIAEALSHEGAAENYADQLLAGRPGNRTSAGLTAETQAILANAIPAMAGGAAALPKGMLAKLIAGSALEAPAMGGSSYLNALLGQFQTGQQVDPTSPEAIEAAKTGTLAGFLMGPGAAAAMHGAGAVARGARAALRGKALAEVAPEAAPEATPEMAPESEAQPPLSQQETMRLGMERTFQDEPPQELHPDAHPVTLYHMPVLEGMDPRAQEIASQSFVSEDHPVWGGQSPPDDYWAGVGLNNNGMLHVIRDSEGNIPQNVPEFMQSLQGIPERQPQAPEQAPEPQPAPEPEHVTADDVRAMAPKAQRALAKQYGLNPEAKHFHRMLAEALNADNEEAAAAQEAAPVAPAEPSPEEKAAAQASWDKTDQLFNYDRGRGAAEEQFPAEPIEAPEAAAQTPADADIAAQPPPPPPPRTKLTGWDEGQPFDDAESERRHQAALDEFNAHLDDPNSSFWNKTDSLTSPNRNRTPPWETPPAPKEAAKPTLTKAEAARQLAETQGERSADVPHFVSGGEKYQIFDDGSTAPIGDAGAKSVKTVYIDPDVVDPAELQDAADAEGSKWHFGTYKQKPILQAKIGDKAVPGSTVTYDVAPKKGLVPVHILSDRSIDIGEPIEGVNIPKKQERATSAAAPAAKPSGPDYVAEAKAKGVEPVQAASDLSDAQSMANVWNKRFARMGLSLHKSNSLPEGIPEFQTFVNKRGGLRDIIASMGLKKAEAKLNEYVNKYAHVKTDGKWTPIESDEARAQHVRQVIARESEAPAAPNPRARVDYNARTPVEVANSINHLLNTHNKNQPKDAQAITWSGMRKALGINDKMTLSEWVAQLGDHAELEGKGHEFAVEAAKDYVAAHRFRDKANASGAALNRLEKLESDGQERWASTAARIKDLGATEKTREFAPADLGHKPRGPNAKKGQKGAETTADADLAEGKPVHGVFTRNGLERTEELPMGNDKALSRLEPAHSSNRVGEVSMNGNRPVFRMLVDDAEGPNRAPAGKEDYRDAPIASFRRRYELAQAASTKEGAKVGKPSLELFVKKRSGSVQKLTFDTPTAAKKALSNLQAHKKWDAGFTEAQRKNLPKPQLVSHETRPDLVERSAAKAKPELTAEPTAAKPPEPQEAERPAEATSEPEPAAPAAEIDASSDAIARAKDEEALRAALSKAHADGLYGGDKKGYNAAIQKALRKIDGLGDKALSEEQSAALVKRRMSLVKETKPPSEPSMRMMRGPSLRDRNAPVYGDEAQQAIATKLKQAFKGTRLEKASIALAKRLADPNAVAGVEVDNRGVPRLLVALDNLGKRSSIDDIVRYMAEDVAPHEIYHVARRLGVFDDAQVKAAERALENVTVKPKDAQALGYDPSSIGMSFMEAMRKHAGGGDLEEGLAEFTRLAAKTDLKAQPGPIRAMIARTATFLRALKNRFWGSLEDRAREQLLDHARKALSTEGGEEARPFDRSAAKQARDAALARRKFQAKPDDLGIVSAAEEALGRTDRVEGSGATWRNEMLRWGVTKEALGYVFPEGFFDRPHVSREAVAQAISERKLRLDSVDRRPSVSPLRKATAGALDAIANAIAEISYRNRYNVVGRAVGDIPTLLADIAERINTEDQLHYSEFALKGGSKYRETLYTLPPDRPGGEFGDQHFPLAKGLLLHSRSQQWGIGRVVEEMQSFAHQTGRDHGYTSGTVKTRQKAIDAGFAALNAARADLADAVKERSAEQERGEKRGPAFQKWLEAERTLRLREIELQSALAPEGVDSQTPLRRDWIAAGVGMEIYRAAKDGERGIWFAPPEVQNGIILDEIPEGQRLAYGVLIPAAVRAIAKAHGLAVEGRALKVKDIDGNAHEIHVVGIDLRSRRAREAILERGTVRYMARGLTQDALRDWAQGPDVVEGADVSGESGRRFGFRFQADSLEGKPVDDHVIVQLNRTAERNGATELSWDWGANARRRNPDAAFEAVHPQLSPKDSYRLIQQILSVYQRAIENDRAPAYTWQPATRGLKKIYRRVLSDFAQESGYRPQELAGNEMALVRKDASIDRNGVVKNGALAEEPAARVPGENKRFWEALRSTGGDRFGPRSEAGGGGGDGVDARPLRGDKPEGSRASEGVSGSSGYVAGGGEGQARLSVIDDPQTKVASVNVEPQQGAKEVAQALMRSATLVPRDAYLLDPAQLGGMKPQEITRYFSHPDYDFLPDGDKVYILHKGADIDADGNLLPSSPNSPLRYMSVPVQSLAPKIAAGRYDPEFMRGDEMLDTVLDQRARQYQGKVNWRVGRLIENQLRKWIDKNEPAISKWISPLAFMRPLGSARHAPVYFGLRMITQGKIANAEALSNDIVQRIAKINGKPVEKLFGELSAEDKARNLQISEESQRVVDYLETFKNPRAEERLLASIKNPELRKLAKELKDATQSVLDVVNDRGLMTPKQAILRHREFLWRTYADEMDDYVPERGIKMSGLGFSQKHFSDQAERYEAAATRGEINNLGLRVDQTIRRLLHDTAIHDFFHSLVEASKTMDPKDAWVHPESVVEIDGVKRSILSLERERQNISTMLQDARERIDRTGVNPKTDVTYQALLDARIKIQEALVESPTFSALQGKVGKKGKYVLVPNDPEIWGPLAGSFVKKEIYHDLQGSPFATDNPIAAASQSATQVFKFLWVPLNYLSHIRTWLGNAHTYIVSGGAMNHVPQALGSILAYHAKDPNIDPKLGAILSPFKGLDDTPVKIAIKSGQYNGTFTAAELRRFVSFHNEIDKLRARQNAEDIAEKLGPAYGILGKQLGTAAIMANAFMRGLDTAKHGVGEIYAMSDKLFKVAKISHELSLGTPWLIAANRAREAYHDMSLAPRWVKGVSGHFGPVATFFNFMYQSMVQHAHYMAVNPHRMALYFWLPLYMSGALADLQHHDGGDDSFKLLRKDLVKAVAPKWMRDRPMVVRIPGLDEHGRDRFVDLTPYVPYGSHVNAAYDLFAPSDELPNPEVDKNPLNLAVKGLGRAGKAMGELGFQGSPMYQIFLATAQGQTIDGYPVFDQNDSESVQNAKKLAYASQALMPGMVREWQGPTPYNPRGGAMWEKFINPTGIDAKGQPVMSDSAAIAHLALGASVKELDRKFQTRMARRQLMAKAKYARQEYTKFLKNKEFHQNASNPQYIARKRLLYKEWMNARENIKSFNKEVAGKLAEAP